MLQAMQCLGFKNYGFNNQYEKLAIEQFQVMS